MTPVKPLHTLVIEDDADTRANLRDILEMDDHRVESVGSAAEALERDDWSTVSAIILDRGLPDATADELLPRLRHVAPDAAVIVVTGYADLQGAISALRQGATDYILKPIEPDDLRSRLRRVAEVRCAREALRLAERRYRLLVQNSSDIITVFTEDGTVLYQNPTIERMLGYRPEDRIGKNMFIDPIVHPDDEAALRAFLHEARHRRGVSVVAEFRMRHLDGSWRYIEAVGQDLSDDPGVGAIVASHRDVTERKQAEEAMRSSEERFRRLFEAGIVGVGISDRSGSWLEANDELLRILGHGRDELAAGEVRWVEMTPAKYAHLDREGLAEAERSGACAPYEKEYLRKDGTPVPVLLGYATLGSSGDRFICVVLDITAAKRSEDLLRRERDFARGLIEGAPALVLVLDSAGRIVRFNSYAEVLSGYRADEVIGRDFFATLLHERDRTRIGEAFRRTLGSVDAGGTVSPILTKDGREREVRWSNRVLSDPETQTVRVLAIGQDVTDLREAQERALRAERLAAIGQMVAGLAHESRNALQRSQACLEMLALHVEGRPEALDLIVRLQRAQDHLHHLYEDVRDYAAPIRLERTVCELAAIWREAWSHLEPQRKGRQASLREGSADLDLRCKVDPFRLERVFSNLLENSLAACSDPVLIEVACTPAEIAGLPALRVTLRDNGPGVGPEDRERIFEPFHTTKTKGTGLGMAISRRIVEAHGGRIVVGDGAGRGAEFTITLPRGEP